MINTFYNIRKLLPSFQENRSNTNSPTPANSLAPAASCRINFITGNQTITKTCEVVKTFFTSVIGRYTVDATKENIVEGIGGWAGAEMLAPVIRSVFGHLARKAGQQTGSVLSLLGTVASTLGAIKFANHETLMSTRNLLLTAATALNGFLVINYAPASLASLGEYAGGEIGQVVGEQLGGIIGGYLMIKTTGSDEKFWDSSAPLETYPVKSLKCAMAVTLMNTMVRNVLGGVQDLAVGSLVWNAGAIYKFIFPKKGENIFPVDSKLDSYITPRELYEFLIEALEKNTSMRENLPEWLASDYFKPLMQPLQDSLKQNGLIAANVIMKLGNVSSQTFLATISDFRQTIQSNPEIQSKYEDFKIALKAYSKEQTPQNQSSLDDAKAALKKTLDQSLETYSPLLQTAKKMESVDFENLEKAIKILQEYKKGIDRSPSAQMINALDLIKKAEPHLPPSPLKEFAKKVTESKLSQILAIMKTYETYTNSSLQHPDIFSLLHLLKQTTVVLPKEIAKQKQDISKQMIIHLNQFEKKVVGFALSGKKEQLFLESHLELFSESLVTFLIIKIAQGGGEIGQEEVKKCALSISDFIASYCEGIAGSTVTQTMLEIMKRHIKAADQTEEAA